MAFFSKHGFESKLEPYLEENRDRIAEKKSGLNPMAVQEMMRIFREKSGNFQIFINTHSETFVRLAQPGDLFMVDKKEGKTLIRNVWRYYPNYDYSRMGLNRMWLSNMFGGGLPW